MKPKFKIGDRINHLGRDGTIMALRYTYHQDDCCDCCDRPFVGAKKNWFVDVEFDKTQEVSDLGDSGVSITAFSPIFTTIKASEINNI